MNQLIDSPVVAIDRIDFPSFSLSLFLSSAPSYSPYSLPPSPDALAIKFD